ANTERLWTADGRSETSKQENHSREDIMRTVGFVLAVLILAALLLGGMPSTLSGQQPAATPKEETLGKYVFVYGGVHSSALENAQVKKLGDRYFVVGRVVDDPNLPNRLAGSTLFLPLSDVKSLATYETLDDLKKVWAKGNTR